MWISSAHIPDELDLLGSVLIRMRVRPSGTVAEGFYRTVKTAFPAVNILTVGFVLDSSFRHAIFFSVTDQG